MEVLRLCPTESPQSGATIAFGIPSLVPKGGFLADTLVTGGCKGTPNRAFPFLESFFCISTLPFSGGGEWGNV